MTSQLLGWLLIQNKKQNKTTKTKKPPKTMLMKMLRNWKSCILLGTVDTMEYLLTSKIYPRI